jgi:hypothetical protein
MLKQIEGSRAVAICRPQVICAYPTTPQTHIVEALSALVKRTSWPPKAAYSRCSKPRPGQVATSTPIRHQVPVTDYPRIQAAADRKIRRFGLAPLGTERAEVAVPGQE